jgi:predicted flap endonuclease-1-like 5' DNA nuclease
MFEEWGFLIGEMVLLIILAALLGLVVGWIIWGRRSSSASAEVDALRADLSACRKEASAKDTRIASLEGELAAARNEAQAAEKAAMEAAAEAVAVAEAVEADHGAHPVHPEAPQDFDGDGVIEGADEGTKPATLDAPRESGADDLKMIKGIGPKLEALCNTLGFYHFDQIANWTAEEIAWVDANLEGFKGRVSRDNWVAQAKVLAGGGTTEFADRVKDGEVYE